MAYFSKPFTHPALKTWSSNIVIPVGDYLISYSGDDGNSGNDGDVSVRHYLRIMHKDIPSQDLTEEIGFETYGVIDLIDVIDTVRQLI